MLILFVKAVSFSFLPQFLFPLSAVSSRAALEEKQRWLKTQRPHTEREKKPNDVSRFNKMLAQMQRNAWLAGKWEE